MHMRMSPYACGVKECLSASSKGPVHVPVQGVASLTFSDHSVAAVLQVRPEQPDVGEPQPGQQEAAAVEQCMDRAQVTKSGPDAS